MKTQTFLCLSMVVLGLAACERDPAVLAEQDYRIAHPLTAERQTALAVFDGPIVSDFDRDRLRQLAAQSLRRGAGRVEVTVIASPQEKDEAASVGDGVAAMLHLEGVKEMAVELRLEPGAALETQVRVPVWTAVVPGCGTFERGMNPDHTNAPNSNWGCSVQRDMALMIQNPADLVRAREASGRDANRSADVLGKYQRGEATSSAIENQTAGTTSSVGSTK